MYFFASELQRRLGDDFVMVIVDFEPFVTRESAPVSLTELNEAVSTLVREWARDGALTLVGFSSGGNLALQLPQALLGGTQLSIWLLDSYALRTGMHRVVKRATDAWQLLVRKPLAFPAQVRQSLTRTFSPKPVSDDDAAEAMKSVIHNALYHRPRWNAESDVQLIQASETVADEQLLWRRESNGFPTHAFRSWELHSIRGRHLELTARLVVEVAGIIGTALQAEYSAAKPLRARELVV